jgi:hypothetical protein
MGDTYTGQIKERSDRTKNMLSGNNAETSTPTPTTSEAEVGSNYCNYFNNRR